MGERLKFDTKLFCKLMQTGNFYQGKLTGKRYARGTQRGSCA